MKKSLLVASAFFLITSVITENAFGMEKKEEESKKRHTAVGKPTPSAKPEKRRKSQEDTGIVDDHQEIVPNFALIGRLARQMQILERGTQDPEGAAQIAVPVAAAASAEAADNRCGICFLDFGSKNEAGQVVTQIKLPCCSYTICEQCLEETLKVRPVCPQCSEPIKDIRRLKDKTFVAIMNRKIKQKRDMIKKEQEETREREKREQEAARIQEQIRKFSSGEDVTAYFDVSGDTLVNVSFILREAADYDRGLIISTQLPILHFLAKGGPNGHDEFKDAFELVKYFVEEKHANINQKVRIPDQTKRFYGNGTVGIDQWLKDHPFYEDYFVELTPLEIAEVYGNQSIAAYLRGKIAEQQAAQARVAEQEQQAREAAERRAPPEKCAIQ